MKREMLFKRMYKSGLLIFITLVSLCAINAQIKAGLHPTILNADVALKMEHGNKDMLLPRIELLGASSLATLSAHVAGSVVFNTKMVADVIPGYYYKDGSKWVRLDGVSVTMNTLINALNTYTSAVDRMSTAAPSVNSLSAMVYGMSGSDVAIINSNVLSGTASTLMSTVIRINR